VIEENELPEGWVNTKLKDICAIIMGQSPPSSAYNEDGEGLPFFQGKAEFTDRFPEVRKWCNAPTKIAEENDILLSVRAPVGPTNLAPSLCCIGRGLAAIRPDQDIQVLYVFYAIRAFNSFLTEQGTGTTFDAVSGDDIRTFEIPLAPTNEQDRIIAAIEQQFTRLDAGVASLRRAKEKLKRYRAAVLKTAVEGKLTEEWRGEHPTTRQARRRGSCVRPELQGTQESRGGRRSGPPVPLFLEALGEPYPQTRRAEPDTQSALSLRRFFLHPVRPRARHSPLP